MKKSKKTKKMVTRKIKTTAQIKSRIPRDPGDNDWQTGDIVCRRLGVFNNGHAFRVGKVIGREKYYSEGGFTDHVYKVRWLDGQISTGYFDHGLSKLNREAIHSIRDWFKSSEAFHLVLWLYRHMPLQPRHFPGEWIGATEAALQKWNNAGSQYREQIEWFGFELSKVAVYPDGSWTHEDDFAEDPRGGSDDFAWEYWPQLKIEHEN